MPLIDLTSLQELTSEQQRAKNLAYTLQLFKDSSTKLFLLMVQTYIDSYDLLWYNKYGLAPQEILDGFGTDAVQLFSSANLLLSLINEVSPSSIPADKVSPPVQITINEDGTVTV